ncbi:MAG: carbamoyltransferase HypF [Cyclobacteriaceae bacterium]|nr:carbamoyltransferase HypF [Cyclobacteriaceae bacterium]
MKSYHIHIRGRVQGLGFRPFVYRLASAHGLQGTVANTSDGVHIVVNASEEKLSQYIKDIGGSVPEAAMITDLYFEEVPYREFTEFSIRESELSLSPDLLVSPDYAICSRCKSELYDPENRRYQYAFITCTTCGPRFSVEESLPYDRQRTSMKSFAMCADCLAEYQNPHDSRFYAQTNSCPNCKISQWVVDDRGMQISLEEHEVVDFICQKIAEGHIVGAKGIGGFLLLCDAKNQKAIARLRHKKHRPAKPFALMYPNLDLVLAKHVISQKEKAALRSTAAPIVLIKMAHPADELQKDIAPGLDSLGIMLPYSPIFMMIAEKLSRPLLATSANYRGAPVIHKNEDAVHILGEFADFILLNNRDIQIPQDDSVVKFTPVHQQRIIIRRARGLAPGFYAKCLRDGFQQPVLAMGALMKSTFCIWQNGSCHISQYLGDTSTFDAQLSYDFTLNHFQNLLQFKPEMVLVDKHPTYFATQGGKAMAASLGVPFREIQHHEAHLWAVLGEHGLLEATEKILGVVFDGMGMGHDGAVWGGEFYCVHHCAIVHVGQMKYFTHILGDKMAREPRLSALSLLHTVHQECQQVREAFTAEEFDFYNKVLDRSSLQSSSVGRLCDAIASLLGLCQINTYEGEAATYLENEAQKYCDRRGSYPPPYPIPDIQFAIDHQQMMVSILEDMEQGKNAGEIAARYHRTLVEIILRVAVKQKTKALAFSGGVFQNSLLVDMLTEVMGKSYTLYFHQELSPNDECISFGQLVSYYASQKSGAIKQDVSSVNIEKPCA